MATYTAGCSQVGSFSYAKYFTLYVVLSNRDGNSSTNQSLVDYNVYCQSSSSGSISANHTLYFNLGGNVYRNENVYVNVSSPNAYIHIASGTMTATHNSDGTMALDFSASITATGGYGVSASVSGTFGLTTINRYANLTSLSVQSRTHNSITLKYTTDRAAKIYINLNNGQNWLNNGNPFVSNTTSGTITIRYKDRASTQRLDPNTTYNITVLCRNNSVDLDTSKNISATTYDIAKISSLPDFEHGNDIIANITNPASISNLVLSIKIGDVEILNRTVVKGDNSIQFSDIELDKLYKQYGSSSNLTATFVLTGDGYTHSKTCIITLKGNQKTIKINQLQTWKRGKMWIYILSAWLRCVVWKKKNGIWKRGI